MLRRRRSRLAAVRCGVAGSGGPPILRQETAAVPRSRPGRTGRPNAGPPSPPAAATAPSGGLPDALFDVPSTPWRQRL